MNTIFPNNKKARGTAMGLLATFVLMALLLIFSDRVAIAVSDGLSMCGRTLIPALFPFLVLNGISMRMGFPEFIGKTLGKPLGRLLHIHPNGVSAVIVGLLCGFPTGAAAACRIYKEGLCDRESFEKTVLLSSVAAPGYVIIGVGSLLLGDLRLGLLLWLIQVTATFTVGAIFGRRYRDFTVSYTKPYNTSPSFLRSLSESLKDAVTAMLGICASVIFFSVWGNLLSLLPLPPGITCLAVCFLELSSGVACSASSLSVPYAFIAIAGALGWSGLSVHAQIVSVTDGFLSVRRFCARKGLISIIAAALAAAVMCLKRP